MACTSLVTIGDQLRCYSFTSNRMWYIAVISIPVTLGKKGFVFNGFLRLLNYLSAKESTTVIIKVAIIVHCYGIYLFFYLFQICLTFLIFALVGWGPYGYFAMWTAFSDLKSVTMLASTLPPLFAKGATCLYPIPFLVASDRFREACVGQPLTNPVIVKKGN